MPAALRPKIGSGIRGAATRRAPPGPPLILAGDESAINHERACEGDKAKAMAACKVRKHLARITRGLFAVKEEQQMDDGTFTAVVWCYEGRSPGDPDGVDCRPHGMLASYALKELAKWPARGVTPGKLGCIEDPERGVTYGQDAVYLLQDIVTDLWDARDSSMWGMDWGLCAGRISEEQYCRLTGYQWEVPLANETSEE
jgi:hypothetical protein